VITISNATVAFGENAPPVLEAVSLSIEEGEFVSVVGASGCGKSTLLNMIAGLESPRDGRVEVESAPSLIFQDPALFGWLSARDNVALALHDKGLRRADQRSEAKWTGC